jgi:hypothetical protein
LAGGNTGGVTSAFGTPRIGDKTLSTPDEILIYFLTNTGITDKAFSDRFPILDSMQNSSSNIQRESYAPKVSEYVHEFVNELSRLTDEN